MIRNCRHKLHNVLYCLAIPLVKAKYVETDNSDDSVWSRIKIAFEPTEYSEMSPDLAYMINVTTNGTFVGCFIGAILQSRNKYVNFMETAQANQYQSHLDAKADLTNRMNRGMYKGAMAWGTRFLLISFVWSCLHTFIPLFRNEKGWQEHIVSGLVSGTIGGYLLHDPKALGMEVQKQTGRFSFKTKSMFMGIAIGLALGASITGFKFASNSLYSGDDARYWDNYWKKQRENRTKES